MLYSQAGRAFYDQVLIGVATIRLSNWFAEADVSIYTLCDARVGAFHARAMLFQMNKRRTGSLLDSNACAFIWHCHVSRSNTCVSIDSPHETA
jgi:hypothetical protein